MRAHSVWMLGVGLLVTVGSRPAVAQPVGTFSWQLTPFCNVVTVNVTQNGAIYTLDGFDNQCGGANPRAPAVGLVTSNPNGSLGLGLTVVTAPSGAPVHVAATIFLPSLNGVWQDSAGNSGPFVFSGNGAGTPRPDPGGTGSGDVTGVVAGTGLTGGGTSGDVTLSVNTAAIQARVVGTCGAGEAVRTVNSDGTVVCQTAGSGDITAVTAGTGLTGGATTGNATLAIQPGGVTTALLAASAVDATKIASGAITSAKIAADAVTSSHIATNAVTSAKIGAFAVTSSHIGFNAINDTLQIASGAIAVSDLGVGAGGVSTGPITISARSCAIRTLTPIAVTKGSLMVANPDASNPVMPGLTSVPMIAMDDGPFVFQICNGTASDVTTGFSFTARVMAP